MTAHNDESLLQELRVATAAAREFAGCDAYKMLIDMLDATVRTYGNRLLTISAEELPRQQAAAAQALAIRGVLLGLPHSQPVI